MVSLEDGLAGVKISSNDPGSSDLKTTLEAFARDDADNEQRAEISASYAKLARLLLPSSGNGKQADRKEQHVDSIARVISNWLNGASPAANRSPDFEQWTKAFSALTAVLQVDLASFQTILQQHDGVKENLMAAAHETLAEQRIVNEQEKGRAIQALALLASQTAGYTPTQSIARAILQSPGNTAVDLGRANPECQGIVAQTATVVAMIKLSLASPAAGLPDKSNLGQSQSGVQIPPQAKLLDLLLVRLHEEEEQQRNSVASHTLALEGLALLSLKPSMRRSIASDSRRLVQSLLRTLQLGQSSEQRYSTASLLVELTSYHRKTSGEKDLKERLKDYAKASLRQVADRQEPEDVESDDEIDARLSELMQAGIVQILLGLVKSPSAAVRGTVGKVLLNLVDKRERRGTIVQQGGARALLTIIKQSRLLSLTPQQSSAISTDIAEQDLATIQALAKILITSNPLLILGPTSSSPALFDAIWPLAIPVVSDDATLLQTFESLMALTNIAGLSIALQEKIAQCGGLLGRLEQIMLEGDAGQDSGQGRTMCRRAATELLCNMVSCDTVFLRYTAADLLQEQKQDGDAKKVAIPQPVQNRLHLLIALADCDDLATRQASLGALATLTIVPTASGFIADSQKRFQVLLGALGAEDVGTQLRAIECVKNVAVSHHGRIGSAGEAALEALQALKSSSREQDVRISVSEAIEAVTATPEETT